MEVRQVIKLTLGQRDFTIAKKYSSFHKISPVRILSNPCGSLGACFLIANVNDPRVNKRMPKEVQKLTALLLLCVFFSFDSHAQSPVDWSQPAVGCVEELVPSLPDRACLDLSSVVNPMKDWPSLPQSELDYWQQTKRPINYCRAQEVFRREASTPGSMKDFFELAWMYDLAAKDFDAKVTAIYQASRDHKIPAQILTGALYQESLMSALGIAEDGANYSCGIGQSNLREWCGWANKQNAATQNAMGWPKINCSDLSPSLIKPFYEIAKARLGKTPEYQMNKSHFAGIAFRDVAPDFPAGNAHLQRSRYLAATSFIQHCSEPLAGIAAKANEISELYQQIIPAGLRQQEAYSGGAKFNRVCRERGFESQYPLNSGWLLAVGVFNAGGRAVDALAHYNRWDSLELAADKTFQNFTPVDLVEAFYWSGKYKPADDQIHFTTIGGSATKWLWFKSCVLQRHIARVVQHVTLPNVPALLVSLEGKNGCAKSLFDPKTGQLLQSKVPADRQVSAGVK